MNSEIINILLSHNFVEHEPMFGQFKFFSNNRTHIFVNSITENNVIIQSPDGLVLFKGIVDPNLLNFMLTSDIVGL